MTATPSEDTSTDASNPANKAISPLLPLLWLLVPFVLALVWGFLTRD